jgi:hypothetical protein
VAVMADAQSGCSTLEVYFTFEPLNLKMVQDQLTVVVNTVFSLSAAGHGRIIFLTVHVTVNFMGPLRWPRNLSLRYWPLGCCKRGFESSPGLGFLCVCVVLYQ